MDVENLANDSAKAPKLEPTTGMDSADPGSLRDVGASSAPERSELDDPGFRSAWVMPVGLGLFLAAVALDIGMT